MSDIVQTVLDNAEGQKQSNPQWYEMWRQEREKTMDAFHCTLYDAEERFQLLFWVEHFGDGAHLPFPLEITRARAILNNQGSNDAVNLLQWMEQALNGQFSPLFMDFNKVAHALIGCPLVKS